jgi:SAM-dependent methyltransferase
MDIDSLLTSQGYKLGLDDSLWKKESSREFDYSDGSSTEQRIHEIITSCSDPSAFSDELHFKSYDWPSYYHLHRARACIMRPFLQEIQNKRVLEVGSGCGAITSFLGAHCSEVVAVEGSYKRAKITRSRTRRMKNVHVVVADAKDINTTLPLFDVVVLIGVLEYASRYDDDDNAHIRFLQHIRGLLKEEGFIIIAIENQLGLKYYSGIPEDHIGVSWHGTENRYTTGQPRTYGRRILERALELSGFRNRIVAGAFPDYKFTQFILFDRGQNSDHFNVFPLVANAACSDPQIQGESKGRFSLYSSWKAILDNGLGIDLANSLVLIASPKREIPKRLAKDTYGIYYSSTSPTIYCKQLYFINSNAQTIRVERSTLTAAEGAGVSDESPYTNAQSLEEMFFNDLTMLPNANINDAINRTANALMKALTILVGFEELTIEHSVRGRFVDLIPRNILALQTESGIEYIAIDQEWEIPYPITLGYLVYRGLINSLRKGVNQHIVDRTEKELHSIASLALAHIFKDSWVGEKIEEYYSQEQFLMSLVQAGAFQ